MANPQLATLTDAFPGTALNAANWYVEPVAGSGGTPSGTVTVANGILTLSQNTGYTSVNSQNSYDITGSYGFLRLIPDPNSAADQADSGWGIWNSVTAPDGEPGFSNGYEIGVQQGQLYVMQVVGDNAAPFSFSAAYDAAAMAFARIRESGGNLIFGYSADAQTWTEPGWSLTPDPSVLDVTSCSVQIYAGNLGSASAGNAGFADFNVIPASPPGDAGLVQQASGSTAGTSLAVTFPAAVKAGNTVIVAVAGYYGGTVTGITLGGGGGTFTHVGGAGGTGGNNVNLYVSYGVTVSSADLTVTASAAGIIAWAYEAAGAVTVLDVLQGADGNGTSWSSGTTGQTIPYPHLVIGAAAVLDSTASVTPTAPGWANGASYSGVGSSRPCGGVSGYQQPSGAGTYEYAGTASGSSAWGAVAAAFLAVPAPAGTQPGWGGYQFAEHASYTGITATFTIPDVTGGAYDSLWVGLGNVYQCGIYQTYVSGDPGGSWTRPWSWWFPGAGEEWNQDDWPTAAGDSLTVTVQLTASDWLMTIANNTQGWAYTEVKSVLAVNVGSGGSPPAWPYPLSTAQVIIEREVPDLPAYGSVTFTGIATVPAATQPPAPLLTVNTAVNQYPGAYDLAAGAFTMYYNAAG